MTFVMPSRRPGVTGPGGDAARDDPGAKTAIRDFLETA
jgi:hypothetical protein